MSEPFKTARVAVQDPDTGIERELAYAYKDELERLRRIEVAASKVVAFHDAGGVMDLWPNASGLNDLRVALQSQEAGE